jgi:hypothetical protein
VSTWRRGFRSKIAVRMQKRIFYPHSVDLVQLRLLANLPAQRRLRVMLDARELAVGMMRGRLRKEFPNLTSRQLNLKLLEEISRANR